MDARAQLALLTKVKAVFERPGYFLSFPALAPISYAPAAMDFARVQDPAARAALLDFSRLVNLPPKGALFDAQGETFLWEAYDHWLKVMELATDALSAEDQAALDGALALVQQKDATGLATDSAMVVAYKTCRDAWLSAEQAYKSAQMTATASSDPAVQAVWTGTDEPRLRQATSDAEAAWETTGHKAEVEAARATVARLQGGLPHVAWNAWRTAYQPDIDLIVDPGTNERFGPSGYAPGDLIHQTWISFTLGADEIAGLVASAPPELARLLKEDSTPPIHSISLEACSAAVVRSWFDSSPFGAHFWRLPAGEPTLSDGNSPPSGVWPAYVSGVVFARNITVTADAAAAPTRVAALPPLMLRAEVVRQLQPAVAVKQPAPHASPAVQVKRAPVLAQGMPSAAKRPVVVRRAVVDHRMASAPPLRKVAPAPAAAQARYIPIHRLVIATRPVSAAPAPVTPPPQSPPQSPPPPPVPQRDERVSILAFICTPLPKSPDPDPNLKW